MFILKSGHIGQLNYRSIGVPPAARRQNSSGTGIAGGTALAFASAGGTPIARGFILLNKPSCEGFVYIALF